MAFSVVVAAGPVGCGPLVCGQAHPIGLSSYPGLGGGIGGGVEASRGRPQFLDHVDDVENDMDGDAASGVLGMGINSN
ncbi:hypothetical protein [Streptomyces sp. UG1]|uniref:hypothetical protein n=1 Tax=Streptomyces sp. UG1 TaxID=3417652 RepID=UPI003CF78CA0